MAAGRRRNNPPAPAECLPGGAGEGAQPGADGEPQGDAGPTGDQQALAFEKSRRNRFWNIFSGPVDFEEPTLPDNAGAMDGELLPPKVE